MSMVKPVIAVIDDEKDILTTIRAIFRNKYNVITYSDPDEALSKMFEKNIDLIILDIMMPSRDGISVLKDIKKCDPDVDVIMVTALSDSKNTMTAIKSGAYDYISKPFDVDELESIVEKALEKRFLQRENRALKKMADSTFSEMIGKSAGMIELFEKIALVASSNSTVLITGETGCGKEMVAKAIHKNSLRASKPFIAINCAAIPDNLFESELFGHERGAFTGAVERQLGKFEIADGGTIFLDEISCLPLALQSKLLRVLQENEITRIGSAEAIPVDVRVISAANANLLDMSKKGLFREDLYYRLNVIPIHVMPLREREDDIPLFVEYFTDKYNKKHNKKIKEFSPEAITALRKYQWPGNVRELENVIERISVLSQKETILTNDLPCEIIKNAEIIKMPLFEACEDFEKNYLNRAFEQSGKNQTKTAQVLGLDRSTLISKLKKYGII